MTPVEARRNVASLLFLLVLSGCGARSVQIADPNFHPEIRTPAFPIGTGPLVLLGEAHFSFHAASVTA